MAENCGNAGIDMRHMLSHCRARYLLVDRHGRLYYCQTDFPFGKSLQPVMLRMLDQTINIIDNQLLRRYQMINRNRFRMKRVYRIANA